MSSGLIDVLTLHAIQALADAQTFARGVAYFHGGAVGLLDADEYEARASVHGTQRYRVRLAAAPDGELNYESPSSRSTRNRRGAAVNGGGTTCRYRPKAGIAI